MMTIEQIRKFTPRILKIAQKFGISRVFVFGSVARGDATHASDIDLLVELQAGASLFGVAGFCYETEKLLGIHVDVVPASVLPGVSDQDFVQRIQKEAIAL